MLMALTLLTLVSQIPYGNSLFRACIPNSQFQVNGHICRCDAMGRWSEASCVDTRRQNCKPGQIIWEDCSQCICQENGQLSCTNTMCSVDDGVSRTSSIAKIVDVNELWCIPFVSYYVNCSLCVCPSSGKMSEARCARDASCPFKGITDYLAAVKSNVCIPKVMYIFPCLNCLCSDEGYFNVDKCAQTCQKSTHIEAGRRCIPETFYRNNCNVCYCPNNSITDESFCTKMTCSRNQKLYSLAHLRNKSRKCQRNMFTGPTCLYCECKHDGTVNDRACLESECMPTDIVKYDFDKITCSPGEMVPKCIDCFCPRNGFTEPKYCSNICSNEDKVMVLENIIQGISSNHHIIDRKTIEHSMEDEHCEPNSIYKYQRRYCLCPENGDANFNLCTSVSDEKPKPNIRGFPSDIDLNTPCEPNTLVEFECNTCYCRKNGKVDPKWCTYDDCEAKRQIIENQKTSQTEVRSDNCVPGSISKANCNFCICPDSGKHKERACTKNSCTGVKQNTINGLSCEPLAYYTVDCNICYCPKSGIKNVAKCTKNTCEKNFLRSETCVPGKLFSEECNVCVCPPNGSKADRVCMNNTCSDFETPWKQIFKLSQSLSSYHTEGKIKRSLDLCFPGEEFEVGCNVCICPDMGLRVYAICTQLLCDDDEEEKNSKELSEYRELREYNQKTTVHTRRHEEKDDECMTYNLTDSSERKECTPGSMYIIRCRQCICPYMGNINYFCRPLPEGTYCEQAFPGYNYLPMGRRNEENATAQPNISSAQRTSYQKQVKSTHNHTLFQCDNPGRMMDECFICECENDFLVQEHCFRNNASHCNDRTPTFLGDSKKIKDNKNSAG